MLPVTHTFGHPRLQIKDVDMALVKCNECGNMVSNIAKMCPHCGVKKPASKINSKSRLVFILAAIVVAVMAQIFLQKQANEALATAPKAAAKPKECSENPFLVFEVGKVYKSGELSKLIDATCPTSIWSQKPEPNITVFWGGKTYNMVTFELPFDGDMARHKLITMKQI